MLVFEQHHLKKYHQLSHSQSDPDEHLQVQVGLAGSADDPTLSKSSLCTSSAMVVSEVTGALVDAAITAGRLPPLGKLAGCGAASI